MTRYVVIRIAALCLAGCSAELESDIGQQPIMQLQGTALQGIVLQGAQLQDMAMVGFQLAGATLNGAALNNVRIEHGELVAVQNQVTLHGDALVNARLIAQVRNQAANPPTSATVEYQITAVEAEAAGYDPTNTGGTYLYTLTQNVDHTDSWQPACPVDSDGRRAAIPLTATWDEHGNRVESTTLFTFGCTTGAIAKCYRWGYRPWVTTYGDLVATHWACTRLVRADYCGIGESHTHEGTMINVWDKQPSPGPIQGHGTTPPLMVFEAGWNTGGAVCLSHARWLLGGLLISLSCPNRLIAPGLGILNATVCDTVAQVLGQHSTARMFNESNLNVNLGDL